MAHFACCRNDCDASWANRWLGSAKCFWRYYQPKELQRLLGFTQRWIGHVSVRFGRRDPLPDLEHPAD